MATYEGISISLAEVSATSASIKDINKKLREHLDAVEKQMNNLESSWQSDASSTIRERFKAFSPRFQQHWDVIDSYAKFLDTTVEEYNKAETAINSNASAFK